MSRPMVRLHSSLERHHKDARSPKTVHTEVNRGQHICDVENESTKQNRTGNLKAISIMMNF